MICSFILATLCATVGAEGKKYVVGAEGFNDYPLYAFGTRASLSEDFLNAFTAEAGIEKNEQ